MLDDPECFYIRFFFFLMKLTSALLSGMLLVLVIKVVTEIKAGNFIMLYEDTVAIIIAPKQRGLGFSGV